MEPLLSGHQLFKPRNTLYLTVQLEGVSDKHEDIKCFLSVLLSYIYFALPGMVPIVLDKGGSHSDYFIRVRISNPYISTQFSNFKTSSS